MSVRANFADIYLQGMRDRSMRSGTELAREIQLTDWSTAGEQGKPVFVVSTKPSLAQFISTFITGKKSFFDRLKYRSIQVFHLRFLSRKNVEKKFWRMMNFITIFIVKQLSSKQVHSSSSWITILFRLEGS